MIMKSLKNESGFSLVELMVALTLLVIILAIGYLFFDFGVKSFAQGERQSVAQHSIRMTSQFITSELRYASEVEINPSGTDTTGGYRYIYEEEGSIKYKDQNGTRILADSNADEGIIYSLLFIAKDSKENLIPAEYSDMQPTAFPFDLVIYLVDADSGLYTMATSLQVLNLGLYENLIKVTNASSGSNNSVRYQKPTAP